MTKPKVLVCVLTGSERGSWINPDLMVNILQMSKDPRFEVNFFPVRDARPFEVARNLTIETARQIGADWLLSFDNDQFARGNPLDIIAAAGKDQHVIGLTYAMGRVNGDGSARYVMFPEEQPGANDGPFREVQAVGGGALFIRSTVWQRIPRGPWFHWDLESGHNEDVWFCALARRHGFRVWTHRQMLAGHHHTADITRMVCTMAGA